MSYCLHCGRDFRPGETLCRNCGARAHTWAPTWIASVLLQDMPVLRFLLLAALLTMILFLLFAYVWSA